MKRSSIIFLQVVIVLLGLGVLTFLLWEPHVEGVNAQATTLYEIYFDDPFLAYMYVGSIPFFMGLYQGFKLLRYAKENKIFSQNAVKALRTIKYCAIALATAIIAADVYLMIAARLPGNTDDPAGAIALGVIATFASVIVATTAGMFEKILQNAVNIKSENDLTV
jgi:hypothetical protein